MLVFLLFNNYYQINKNEKQFKTNGLNLFIFKKAFIFSVDFFLEIAFSTYQKPA